MNKSESRFHIQPGGDALCCLAIRCPYFANFLRLAAVYFDVAVVGVYCGTFGFACSCKSYADLFRVFLPVSGILVFAAAGVQTKNSLRHCMCEFGTLGAFLPLVFLRVGGCV